MAILGIGKNINDKKGAGMRGMAVSASSKNAQGLMADEPTVSLGFEGSFAEVITGSDMHIGTRPYQQDACYVTETTLSEPDIPVKAYGVLCDGMGGLEDGEKVSNLAVGALSSALDGLISDEGVEEFFIAEVRKLDESVCSECGSDDGGLPKSGTTLCAALIFGGSLYWASVGDSRIYIIRDGDIVQVSRDHNYSMVLKEYVRQGRMPAGDAEGHPKKGALISFIGSGKVRYIDTNSAPFALIHGDIVLLCSDGLVKSLTNPEILEIVGTHYGDMGSAAKALTSEAFDKGEGAKDNTSVVLMQYFI
jgi:protein phosphatase